MPTQEELKRIAEESADLHYQALCEARERIRVLEECILLSEEAVSALLDLLKAIKS